MAYTIGACGFIATGSSVISDFLKEFDENQTLDRFEFKLSYQTDGLQDLKYHLTTGNMKYESGLAAIQRFRKLSRGYAGREYRNVTNGQFEKFAGEFLDSIIQGKWVGTGADPTVDPVRHFAVRLFRKTRLDRKHYQRERKKGCDLCSYPLQEICYAINPENFDAEAKKLTGRILESMGRDPEKNVVLDQPFAGNNPQAAFGFFENPKAIIVDRDPRDYFVHCNVVSYPLGYRFMPIRDVEAFVDLYRRQRKNQPYRVDSEQVMNIRFEDMIYEYEKTAERIMRFCGLTEHTNPKKYFKPEMSVNNTQLYRRYPQFAGQIAYIEKELPEYLYDYSKYEDRNIDFGNPFGDNPLNRVGRKWKSQ
ncbi:MAG: sulfotransferase [Firmicutes bacterium]|nr:sulfotransferase [Bacillota bacterium]